GGGERCEEDEQRQQDEGEDLKQQQAEASGLAEEGRAVPADRRLPGRQADDPEQAERRAARQVMPAAARHGLEFADEDRTEHRVPVNHEAACGFAGACEAASGFLAANSSYASINL